jgi:hypothetical protein
VDRRWSDLEKYCKHAKRLEAVGQGRRGETTGDLGWRVGKKLSAASTNLGRKRRSTRTLFG